jgi:putative peptidoglycan lipid II flippase
VKSQRNKVAQATVLLVVLEFLTAGAGLLKQTIVAAQFGTTARTDAYVVATTIVALVLLWLLSPIRQVIIPMFTHDLARDGEEKAWANISVLLNTTLAIFALVALAGWIFAPALVSLMTPGFSEETNAMAISLTRISLATVIFIPIGGVLTQILFSYQRFFLPGISDLVNNLATLLALLALGSTYGIYGLAAATVLGAACELMSQLPILWEKRRLYRFTLDLHHPGLREMSRLSFPLLFSNSGVELARITDRIFASLLSAGNLSALSFAGRPISILSDMIIDPLQTSIFPHFTRLSAQENFEALSRQHSQYLRVVFFVTLPVTAGLMVLAEPLVRLLYHRGAFDETSVRLTSQALACYALSFPALALARALNRTFISCFKDTWTPTKLSLLRVGIKILLAWLLVQRFAHVGLALAESLSHIIRVLFLLFLLPNQIREPERFSTMKSFGHTLLACALMGAVVYFAKEKITGLVNLPVELGVLVLFGVAVYGTVAFFSKGEEAQSLLKVFTALRTKYLPHRA